MSLPLEASVSASGSGDGAGPGSMEHLNDPDKRNRVATRALCSLQQEISGYRAGKDGRGYVHSSGECTYAVLKSRVRWELLVFCSVVFLIFAYVFYLFLCFFLLGWHLFF